MLFIYGHGGSSNHGNEAILRGFNELINMQGNHDTVGVYSYNIGADKRWEITSLYTVFPMLEEMGSFSPRHIRNYLLRLVGLTNFEMKIRFSSLLKRVHPGDVFLLEAGDQYCEPPSKRNRIRDWYFFLNKEINKRGGKTVMLYCTIPAQTLSENSLIEDLKRYSLIVARESITYEALMRQGLKNVIFSPCCAFMMKPKPIDLPVFTTGRKLVGITVGELAQNKQVFNDNIRTNTMNLIQYLLDNTDYGIVLIPHVNGGTPDDKRLLSSLKQRFTDKRVVLIDERRADEIKYIIAHLDMDITIRTHVSIAAYSSCVPTIVIGYSQKSVGIAKDLFGQSEHYVIDVDDLSDDSCLINEFKWLENNKDAIRDHLKRTIPNYKKTIIDSFFQILKLEQ